jgi:DNA-binding FadR family transcriptional regulator
MSAVPTSTPRRSRNLALELVDSMGDRIRDGRLAPGEKLPTEAEIMAAYGVSRTVVREALSKLQAAGQVRTRHGIGTFVVGPGEATPFRIAPEQLATLDDVIAMLELRIGLETEATMLAAQRRDEGNLRRMRAALADFRRAIESGHDAVASDFRFHLEIARATQNPHYAELMGVLGETIIPRARLDAPVALTEERREYLRRVNTEHETILEAIARGDGDAARAAMRTHLANSRERRRRVRDQPAGRTTTRSVETTSRPRRQVVR